MGEGWGEGGEFVLLPSPSMRYHLSGLSNMAMENIMDLVPEDSLIRIVRYDSLAILNVENIAIPAIRERYKSLFGNNEIEFQECHQECSCRDQNV